jgi:hypothetical protein
MCGVDLPKGPKAQKRPADVTGNVIVVAKIATGEITDEQKIKSAAAELGSKGGKARAKALSKKKRKEIAEKAARSRWKA